MTPKKSLIPIKQSLPIPATTSPENDEAAFCLYGLPYAAHFREKDSYS